MTHYTPVIAQNKHISTPPTLAGLFFCLASAEGAGLLFCPFAIQTHTSGSYTINATKRHTGLYSGVSCDCTHSTAANTRPTQAAIIPPATRWSTHTHRNAPHRYQIPPKRRTLYRSAQPPYYNKVYKGAPPVIDSCQTMQHIADHASPAGSAPTVCGLLASADTLPAVQTRRTR